MASRLPLYVDTDVHGPVVKALQSAGWDVLRGIDAHPEKTRDDLHFARAAREKRVLVSNDIDMRMLAETWFLEGRSYPGPVWWPRSHYEDGVLKPESPLELEEHTEVEVLVMPLARAALKVQGRLSVYLRALPPGTRSTEDIDRQIRVERDSWSDAPLPRR